MEDSGNLNSLAVELSDLEVALFVCLAVGEHCRIDTTDENIHDVAKELSLVGCRSDIYLDGTNKIVVDLLEHIWAL